VQRWFFERYKLHDLVAAAELNATRTRQAPIDDAFLHALLTFAPLTARHTVISFLHQRIQAQPVDHRSLLRDVLLPLFHRALKARHASQYDEYEPRPVSVPAQHAIYSANLLLLIVFAGGAVNAAELFPDQVDPIRDWRKISSLWRSQLSSEGWLVLIDWLMVTRGWEGDQRTLVVELTTRERVEPFDPHWAYCVSPVDEQRQSGWFGWLHDSANVLRTHIDFVTDRGEGAFAHALEPLSLEFGNFITTFFDFWLGRPVSAAHALISLWTESGTQSSQTALTQAHETCLRFAIDGFAPDDAYTRKCFRRMYLTQLAADIAKLPRKWVQEAIERLLTAQGDVKERAELAGMARQCLSITDTSGGAG
jgi:hypothetical protein